MYDLSLICGRAGAVNSGVLANYTDSLEPRPLVEYNLGRTREAYRGLDSTLDPHELPQQEMVVGGYRSTQEFTYDPITGAIGLQTVS